jgi:hypothetical protein
MMEQFEYLSQEIIEKEQKSNYLKLEIILTDIIRNIKATTYSGFNRFEAIRAVNVLKGFSIAHNLKKINFDDLPKGRDEYIEKLTDYLEQLLLDDNINMYADLFIKKAEGKLSDKEYDDIQNMIKNIKETVNKSTTLDEKLRQMILDKINELISTLDQSLTKMEKAKLIVNEINGMIKATHDDVLKPMAETFTNVINKLNPLKKENKQIEYKEDIVDVEVTVINQIEDKTE